MFLKVMKTANKHLRSIRAFIWVIMAVLFFVSCEEELTGDVGTAEALEGNWTVNENSEFAGNTSYQVYIDIYSDDSSSVLISNFYQLGYESGEVIGDISGNRIELRPSQDINYQGITYTVESGTGTISDDYQSIDWQYKVDDGSGTPDNVTAVYSKR
jgi:hypothetical protein